MLEQDVEGFGETDTCSLPKRLLIDDVIEKYVGAAGPWQWTVVLILTINSTCAVVFPVFANVQPLHRCHMGPEIEASLGSKVGMPPFEKLRRSIGPSENQFNVSIYKKPNTMTGCVRYKMNWTLTLLQEAIDGVLNVTENSEIEKCPYGYVYLHTVNQYPSGIISEWDLVCEKSWMPAFSTTAYMFGMLLGFCCSGWLSDRYGRKLTLVIGSLCELFFGIAVSFSPNFTAYCIFRAGIAAVSMANLTVTMVLFMELTIPIRRSTLNTFWGVSISAFRVLVVLFAYLLPNWRHLHFAMIIQGAVCFTFFKLLPESPRWLMSRNRTREALEVLYKGYKLNHTKCCCSYATTDELANVHNFDSFCSLIGADQTILNTNIQYGALTTKQLTKNITPIKKMFGVCSTSRLFRITFFGALIYAGQSATHFGLTFYTRSIRGSIYLVAFLNGIFGIPGTFISGFLYRFCPKRRAPLLGIYLACFVVLLVQSLYSLIAKPDTDLGLIISSNIVLTLIAASFNMLYVYIPELYPPEFRTQGLGYSAGFGRVGGVVCDFINHLEYIIGHTVPVAFYGALTLLAAIAVGFVPDTTGSEPTIMTYQHKGDKDEAADT